MEEFSVASGISRPTLSRFFSDPQSVRPTSRARIEDALTRFNYRPNLFAVNFNRRKPKTLGILVPSLLDPFYAGLVQRIDRLALDAGYWTIVLNAQGDPAQEEQAVSTLLSLKLAGVVAVPLGFLSQAKPYRDLTGALPVVFLDSRIDADGPFVGTDNRQSIGLMVDYLLRSGSPPCFFDMPDVNQNARERRIAYEGVMSARGQSPEIITLAERSWDFERVGYGAAQAHFGRARLAGETILCANDRIAFGVMAAASQAGLAIGRDEGGLRIAGHDDHPLSRYGCPPLTTVAQNHERLATTSLDILMTAIGSGRLGKADQHLGAELVVRVSA